MAHRYRCEICGGRFVSHVSADAALADAIADGAVAPGDAKADLGECCDDCYQRFMAWFRTLSETEKARMRAEAADEPEPSLHRSGFR